MTFTVHSLCGKGAVQVCWPLELGGLPSFPGLEEVRELQAAHVHYLSGDSLIQLKNLNFLQ